MRQRPLAVSFLDVGQADSALIEAPDKRVYLVDTARTGSAASAYLRYLGVRDVDAMILTHPHADHVGGAGRIASEFNVREVWASSHAEVVPGSGLANIPWRTLTRGDKLEGQGYSFLFLHPDEGYYNIDGNDNTVVNDASLTFRMDAYGRSVFFAGDLEEEGIESMSSLDRRWFRADVMKAPHHGLRGEANRTIFALVKPSLIIVTARGERSDAARALGERLAHTGEDGTLRVRLSHDAIRVDKYRDYAMVKALAPGVRLSEEALNIKRLFMAW